MTPVMVKRSSGISGGGMFKDDSEAIAAEAAGAGAGKTGAGTEILTRGASLSLEDDARAALASAAATLPPLLSVSLINLKRAMHCPAVLLLTSADISRHRCFGSNEEG
jgi:hypothetical protein